MLPFFVGRFVNFKFSELFTGPIEGKLDVNYGIAGHLSIQIRKVF